jgi:hypothetical protein
MPDRFTCERNVRLSHDSKPAFNPLASLRAAFFQAVQVIDLRLALGMGLLTFLVAVGFDSAGNQAEAADLMYRQGLPPTITVTLVDPVQRDLPGSPAPQITTIPQGDMVPVAITKRLRHGTLTGAVITSSRLTQAHFFTDLPSRP